jgi:hypothetical protein
VVARRPVHRGAQALHRHARARLGRDLALSCERHGQGPAAQREAELAEGSRRARVLARRPIRLLLAGHDRRPHVRIQQGLEQEDLRHPAPRPARRHGRALRRRAGRRGAPPALAGRQASRLRAPRAQPEHAVPEGSPDGPRDPRLERPRPRHAGDVVGAGRLPGLLVDARLEEHRRLGPGQAVAGRPVRAQRRRDSFPRQGHARGHACPARADRGRDRRSST